MNRHWILRALLFTLALGVAARGHAQSPESAVGDYASLTAGGGINATRLDYGQRWLGGATAFVDANLTWRYGLEGEATWTFLHEQEQVHATTYLIGPTYRLSALGDYKYRPYIKFLIGDGKFTFPNNYAYGNYFVMAPGAGVDYRTKSRFRIRLVDVEYQVWPEFTYGTQSNFSISAGVSYRIR